MSDYIRTTSLLGIKELIAELGGCPRSLLAQSNIEVDFQQLDSQFMQYRDYIELLNSCAKTLDCSDFGLRLAARQHFDILGPIALVAQSGTSLGQVLTWVTKFLHVHCPAIAIAQTAIADSDEVLLSFEIALEPLPDISQVSELSIGLMVAIVRELTVESWSPLRVYLPSKITANNYAYAKHFSTKVTGYRNFSGIVISLSDLNLPIKTKQSNQLQQSLGYLKSQGEHSITLCDKVELIVKPLLAIEQCTNDNVAHILGLHTRQLHRLLKCENTSFIKLKNKVRLKLAWHYLTQTQLRFSHISELLGYQEQATFTAACQRWFKAAPRNIRNST
ncbi:MAG: AraC family transcriptional regulator ligand-binding domain-containing protein [Psychrobium sp.]